MRCAPSAPPASLPPLDREGSDDETLDDRDVGGLLVPLVDLPEEDGDEEQLTDPDFGIEPPSDPFAVEQDTSVDLDIGAGFGLDATEAEADDDDASGLEKTPVSGVDEEEAAVPAEAEEREGIDDGESLDDLDLPDMDADEHGLESEDARFGLLVTADETALPIDETPWRIGYLSRERERCIALALGSGGVVAASSDLLWLDPGRTTPVRIALEGSRVTSLALVGDGSGVALCVTGFGVLVRRARLGSDTERLHDWRRAAEMSHTEAQTLELRQIAPAEPRAVLARLTSGKLVFSEDEGQSFRVLETPAPVRALSPVGSPLLALFQDGALGVSRDAGRSWLYRELPSPAREIAAGDSVSVAGSGDTIVVSDPERGLAISRDGGLTFSIVRGAAGVTACAVGERDGRSAVWAALFREASDASDLLEVTDGDARIVATLLGSGGEDSEQAFEVARIERLLWDGVRLFAVGGAGLLSFQPATN